MARTSDRLENAARIDFDNMMRSSQVKFTIIWMWEEIKYIETQDAEYRAGQPKPSWVGLTNMDFSSRMADHGSAEDHRDPGMLISIQVEAAKATGDTKAKKTVKRRTMDHET